ncbi:PREDICTED: ABC transporter G family member 23-like [Nicrophorus vespilloides]|uniref:ABC transporter G family member 23-like n=1 Tax=Nicrophorus vespilloides TaxID=110193 RepID=A0ABM1NI02_NICVS|nr:PREDICTED: ABC transporter G family member 23-like [Nicrophorus vespilloides]
MENYAVYVKDAVKSYGQKNVLNKLTMKVPRGCIYGLLGASGCGKTTLLSCIVGRKQLNSGEVYVMGGKPGTKGSGVPGTAVGYMPQDIALVGEFTVKDAVYYFGRILNMPDKLIYDRFQELKRLLDLPPDNRFLKECSGGQQRRVSFAAAMIHKPELLILDEPTVGLDPVLRDRIWNYMVEISEKEQIAIIITTHYIEEARQANKIGLMREGRLLAEESPERLLRIFDTDTLENVFLILSRQQEEGRLDALEQNQDDISVMTLGDEQHGSTDILVQRPPKKYNTTTGAISLNSKRMKSLLSKNSKQFLRNPGGIVFTLLFPIIEMLSFFLAVGGDVKGIKLGIVNDESMLTKCSNFTREGTAQPYNFSDCEFKDLGCRFVEHLHGPMMDLIYYNELNVALEDVTHGRIIGVMFMADNFTKAFEARLHKGRKISDETLENSQIQVWLDMSNRQIGATIKYKILKMYEEFAVQTFTDCKLLEKLGKIPMRFAFEFGTEDETYTVFMVPGVLLTVMFFLGTTLTSTIIVTDRLEGVWDRSIVAGVTSLEIVLTHFMSQFVLVFIQTTELVILTFLVFGIDYIGQMWIIFLCVLLQGLTGMVFGFWVSVVSNSHSAANIFSTGIFYPMIILCGMIWPLEAQPTVLNFISKCLPFTLSIVSLREIIKKGRTFTHPEVLSGLGVTLLWIIGISTISVFAIKAKR